MFRKIRGPIYNGEIDVGPDSTKRAHRLANDDYI